MAFFSLVGFTCKAQYTSEDWNDRDTWMQVPRLMALAEVGENNKVADLGCHEGYFTFHLSEKVGDKGKVYAVDVSLYRLDDLKEHLKERAVTNVDVILGDPDDPKLPISSLDVVMLIDTYHEIRDYTTVLEKIKKALKPGGRLLILEKLKAHKKGKGREEQALAHTLSPKYVKQELGDAGFLVGKEVTDFGTWNHEDEKQMWVVVATKPDA
ncbi:methyltransferase domain-containing protein [Flavobacteriaceae bacterium TP-CH-4]|uniref:Methyltransferase domain-containing protein n=1 Tax=Pelagihabitans pacificus TaxID=2696054 RepID=A0A967B0J3_9FLAO|nr:methyltransferase domain-containing protein [Pelagihabitans pacificus]NHF59906.1 methyltransferase domain-containing protein [Pelagihabitans pacificus]